MFIDDDSITDLSYDESLNFYRMCDNKLARGMNELSTNEGCKINNDYQNKGEFDFNDDIELNNLINNDNSLETNTNVVKLGDRIKKE